MAYPFIQLSWRVLRHVLETCITILGIVLDSEKLQARLRADKRYKTLTLLDEWSAKCFCKCCRLESLIAHLHHACKVALQGRTFLCRMINLLCAFRHDDHPIRLNQESGQDLISAGGRSCSKLGMASVFFCLPIWVPIPDFQVSLDAACSLGYGAIFKSCWFSGAWSVAQSL